MRGGPSSNSSSTYSASSKPESVDSRSGSCRPPRSRSNSRSVRRNNSRKEIQRDRAIALGPASGRLPFRKRLERRARRPRKLTPRQQSERTNATSSFHITTHGVSRKDTKAAKKNLF